MNKHIIKLSKKSEYSYTVTIPKDIIEKYGWKAKQKLTVEDKGRGVVVLKDWKNR